MFSGFLNLIDVLGTFAFAVSGAFSAMERKLDPFGVLVISFVTAIGGGTIRDVLVGNMPVSWLHNETAILVILVSSVLSLLFGSYLRQLNFTLFTFDALGLGFFTIVGVEMAIRYGFSAGVCVALGTITACFGGVIRDVLLNKVPLIFRKEIYALACVAGGSLFYLIRSTSLPVDVVRMICILFIFAIRIIAVRYHLALPRFYLNQSK